MESTYLLILKKEQMPTYFLCSYYYTEYSIFIGISAYNSNSTKSTMQVCDQYHGICKKWFVRDTLFILQFPVHICVAFILLFIIASSNTTMDNNRLMTRVMHFYFPFIVLIHDFEDFYHCFSNSLLF